MRNNSRGKGVKPRKDEGNFQTQWQKGKKETSPGKNDEVFWFLAVHSTIPSQKKKKNTEREERY